MIHCSFFLHGAQDNRPIPWSGEWPEFVTLFSKHQNHQGPKLRLPAFSPAEFIPHATRANANVLAVHHLVLDLDYLTPEDIPQILTRLSPYRGLGYTTWSHTPQAPRLRWILPLSRPVPPDEWPAFWASSLRSLALPIPVDPKCKDPSHLYFGPYIPIGSEHPTPLEWDGILFPVPEHILPPAPQTQTITLTRDQIMDLAARWSRSPKEERKTLGRALSSVAKGEPFADPGDRDNTLFRLSRALTQAWEGSPLDTKAAANLFAPSLQVMNWPEATPEFVEAKFLRAITDTPKSQNALLRECWAGITPGRNTPYSPEELSAMAPLANRWIIQRENSYYVRGPKGYSPPYGPAAVITAVHRDLSPAITANVSLFTTEGKPIPLPSLVVRHGATAHTTALNLSASSPRYEPETRTFHEAPTPLLPLVPQFDRRIDQWLRAISGPSYPDLEKWLSFVPDVTLPLTALVLTGAPGVGKTLLAHALASLWGRPPATLDQALAPFNDALIQCPVVFGDEKIPKDGHGRPRTEDIREFIGNRSRPLKRKFLPDATIFGCPRVIIAANNPEILGFNQDLTQDDIAAISERFLHIEVQPQARQILESLFPDPTVVRTQNLLARHALGLWLYAGHLPEGRFSVRSDSTSMLRTMTVSGGVRSLVCQWLTGYLKDPRKFDNNRSRLLLVRQGELLVNAGALVLPGAWELYVTEQVPKLTQISRAITTLSKGRTRVGHNNYRIIDKENLRAWGDATDMGAPDLDRALSQNTPPQPEPQARVIQGPWGH